MKGRVGEKEDGEWHVEIEDKEEKYVTQLLHGGIG